MKSAVAAGSGLGALPALSLSAQGKTDEKTAEEVLPARVPRKTLGTTGESIPILLLGCAQKFDEKYDKILHRCYKEGVDYLDTALVYADGMSHKTIAPFLEQIDDRKSIWITSKGMGRTGEPSPETYTKELDICLEQLGTDYLDLYFMHALDDPQYLDPEYIKMGEALRKSGKTRYFGFSCHGGRQVELLNKAAQVGGLDAIMFRYSFSRYGDLELNKAIDACKKAGIGLIAMKTQDSVPADQEEVVAFESKNFNLAQAKLKAVWADERIDSAVSHMDNTKKLAENVEAAKSPVQLSMNEIQQLRRIARATAEYSCQGCSRLCESRVEGEVKVADTLRFLMYHEAYGEPEKARKLYRELRPEERALEGVDFRAASAACPQGIDIARRMEHARRTLTA